MLIGWRILPINMKSK